MKASDNTAPGRPSGLRVWLLPLAGAAGFVLLVFLIVELGPSRIAAQLHGLGSILPVVLLITAAKYPLQTAGWRLALPPTNRPPWRESIAATITGDALGYLTWAGPFAGEPIRALLMRDSVRVAAGTAAGAMERTIYNLTAAALVWAVLFSLASTTHTAALVAAVAVSVLIVAGFVHRVRRGGRARQPDADVRHGPQAIPTGHAPQRNRAAPPAGSPGMEPASTTNVRPAGRTAEFVEAARELWRTRRGVLPAVALLCLAQHTILIAEAYVILRALSPGTTLQTALVFEAVTKIVNTAGLVVPGRLGVAEGGSALLADALGFAASHGLSLALMRRIRALIWAGVGLGLLPLREARARRRR